MTQLLQRLATDVLELMRAEPPYPEFVVPGSTPVIAFGSALTARVATLGINPSGAEFVGKGGALLEPRRLATTESLGIGQGVRANERHAAQVVHECLSYFENSPYWKWFGPLDKLLESATNTSYTRGTACHLDLVPWATVPVWSGIQPKTVREAYLSAGVPYLRDLLRHLDVNLVLLNGRQVVNQVQATGLAALEPAGTAPLDPKRTTMLYEGVGHGVQFLGWSANIGGTPGANSVVFRTTLAAWISERRSAFEAAVGTPRPDGLELLSAEALVAHFERWLEDSDDLTIAAIGSFGGRSALKARIGRTDVVVNADTKRAAVIELIELARAGSCAWQVVTNMSGKSNKVVFRPDGSSTPGWYCYTTSPTTVGALTP